MCKTMKFKFAQDSFLRTEENEWSKIGANIDADKDQIVRSFGDQLDMFYYRINIVC